jgi:putative ABC transport system permease protein
VDPGFRPNGLLTFQLSLPVAGYESPEKSAHFYDQLATRLESLPNLIGAATVNYVPMTTPIWTSEVTLVGDAGPAPTPDVRIMSPGYLKTMGIVLRRGRDFEHSDDRTHPLVVIINEALARRLVPTGNALGRRVQFNGAEREIVGVAGNVRHYGLSGEPHGEIYLPAGQDSRNTRVVVVRTSGDPNALVDEHVLPFTRWIRTYRSRTSPAWTSALRRPLRRNVSVLC